MAESAPRAAQAEEALAQARGEAVARAEAEKAALKKAAEKAALQERSEAAACAALSGSPPSAAPPPQPELKLPLRVRVKVLRQVKQVLVDRAAGRLASCTTDDQPVGAMTWRWCFTHAGGEGLVEEYVRGSSAPMERVVRVRAIRCTAMLLV